MGTRSIILVTGKDNYGGDYTYRLYKHYDGYPTGALHVIKNGIKLSNKLSKLDNKECYTVECLKDCIIASSITSTYTGIKEEQDFVGNYIPECLGNQGDLEWIYIVDLENKNVSIYQCTSNDNIKTISKGVSNPLKYLECLKEEYKKEGEKLTKSLIRSIKRLGFTVNSELKRTLYDVA